MGKGQGGGEESSELEASEREVRNRPGPFGSRQLGLIAGGPEQHRTEAVGTNIAGQR